MSYQVQLIGRRIGMQRSADLLWSPETEVRVFGRSGRTTRLQAIVDSGCARSVFRFSDLEAAGVERPTGENFIKREFRSATGLRFDGFQVSLKLQVGELPPVDTILHATDLPIQGNLLGADFLAAHVAALDFGEGSMYLSEYGVRPVVTPI